VIRSSIDHYDFLEIPLFQRPAYPDEWYTDLNAGGTPP